MRYFSDNGNQTWFLRESAVSQVRESYWREYRSSCLRFFHRILLKFIFRRFYLTILNLSFNSQSDKGNVWNFLVWVQVVKKAVLPTSVTEHYREEISPPNISFCRCWISPGQALPSSRAYMDHHLSRFPVLWRQAWYLSVDKSFKERNQERD